MADETNIPSEPDEAGNTVRPVESGSLQETKEKTLKPVVFADKVKRAVTEIQVGDQRTVLLSEEIAQAVEETTVEIFDVLAEQNYREIGYHALHIKCEGEHEASEDDLQNAEHEHIIQHLKMSLVGNEMIIKLFEQLKTNEAGETGEAKLMELSISEQIKKFAGITINNADPEEAERFDKVFDRLATFYASPTTRADLARVSTYISMLHDAKETEGRLVHEDNAMMLAFELKEAGRLDFKIDSEEVDAFLLITAGIDASRMSTTIPPVLDSDLLNKFSGEEKEDLMFLEAVRNIQRHIVHRADYERNASLDYSDIEWVDDPDKLKNQAMMLLTAEAINERAIEDVLKIPKVERSNLLETIESYNGDPVAMLQGSEKFVGYLRGKFNLFEKMLGEADLPNEIKERFSLEAAESRAKAAVEVYTKDDKVAELRLYQTAVMTLQQSVLSSEQKQLSVQELQDYIKAHYSSTDEGLRSVRQYSETKQQWLERKKMGM